jgi:hypothetical protein
VQLEIDQGITVIGSSDRPASPLFVQDRPRFVVPVARPLFVMLKAVLHALLETLMASVIADAHESLAAKFKCSHEQGIFLNSETSLS